MNRVQNSRQQIGPRVFVAMPFGLRTVHSGGEMASPSPSPAAVTANFDDVWSLLLRPALERAGCRPFRADEELNAGDIRTDMFFELVTGEFVLADISTLNANVFYELGVRHGISPRGVLMVDGGWDRRPFDVAPDRTFSYLGELFESDTERDNGRWSNALAEEVNRLAMQLESAVASDASTVSSPVYKELVGLKPVDWGDIQNAKARYFGSQLQEWNARVRKARRQNYVGDILTLSRDAPNRFIEWQLRLDAAKALYDLERFERARELLRAMATEDPHCAETRYALAKTLDSLARLSTQPDLKREYRGRAEIEIQEALNRHGDSPEAHRLLGRIYKYRWRNHWETAKEEEQRRILAAEHWETAKKALWHYREAQIRDLGCFHAGINVICLARIRSHLGLNEQPDALEELDDLVGVVRIAAKRTLELAQRDPTPTRDESDLIWATAALGEIALLEGRGETARRLLQRAVTHPEISVSQLRSFDDQLAMYEKLGLEADEVVSLRDVVQVHIVQHSSGFVAAHSDSQIGPPTRVFAFRGESFHEPGFEQAVRRRLTRLLMDEWQLRRGDLVICAGRRGSELLFIESCIELGAQVKLMLPLGRSDFVSQAVRYPGSDWEKRFYQLAACCEVIEQPLRLGPTPAELDPFERNNVWCLDVARTELGPNMRPRVALLTLERGGDENLAEQNNLSHFEQYAQCVDLLVELLPVADPSQDITWLPGPGVQLTITRPDSTSYSVALRGEMGLGRADDNAIVIHERRISRHHLSLQEAADGVRLYNLSRHPGVTCLDGESLPPDPDRISPVLIAAGQRITLADGTVIDVVAQ